MDKALAFKRRLRFLSMVLRDKSRKSILKMISEMIYLTFLHRTFPSFYFTRRLYLKEIKEIRNYLPNKFLYGIAPRINDLMAAEVLSNKLYYDLFYRKFTNRLPAILAFNHGTMFITGNKHHSVKTLGEFDAFLTSLVREISPHGSVFIKKTYDSGGGKNTYRVTKEELPLSGERLESMYKSILGSAYLFQATIVQHPVMDRLNPSCINSVRMDTFVNKDGKSEILTAYVRMSINNSHVDNSSSGGCFVGIDMEKGELMKNAYTFITVSGGLTFTSHPLTGTVFQGFRVPYLEECRELVIKMANLVPSLRLIGWDVAISEDGPVLIEGNSGYDITSHDMIYSGYRKNPSFQKVLAELNERKYLN